MSGPVSIRPLWFLAQEREACFNAAAATTGICRGVSSGRKNTALSASPSATARKLVRSRFHSSISKEAMTFSRCRSRLIGRRICRYWQRK